MICSFPVHRVDPANYVAYVHLMGIVRAVQTSEKVRRAWQVIYEQDREKTGLCATYKTYLKRLRIEDRGEPLHVVAGRQEN